jgi:aryl carrier-like protein
VPEATLCALYCQVLGLARVGADDNFFDLGGDSILSMELVSHARAAGINISPRDVRRAPTPTALASTARASTSGADGPRTGQAPLTPAMRWLAERNGPLERFCQSVTLAAPPGLGLDQVTVAVRTVLRHHEALGMRLLGSGDPKDWHVEIGPEPPLTTSLVVRVDVRGLPRARWASGS